MTSWGEKNRCLSGILWGEVIVRSITLYYSFPCRLFVYPYFLFDFKNIILPYLLKSGHLPFPKAPVVVSFFQYGFN